MNGRYSWCDLLDDSYVWSDCGSVAVSDVPVKTDVCVPASFLVSVRCEGELLRSDSEFGEPHSLSFSRKRAFACVESQEDMNYNGTSVNNITGF